MFLGGVLLTASRCLSRAVGGWTNVCRRRSPRPFTYGKSLGRSSINVNWSKKGQSNLPPSPDPSQKNDHYVTCVPFELNENMTSTGRGTSPTPYTRAPAAALANERITKYTEKEVKRETTTDTP